MYARYDYNKFSTIKHDGYTNFAENVSIRHAEYEISRSDGLIHVPKNSLETFSSLKERLLGPKLDQNFTKHFIDKCPERVAYTSYSRSGNTFLRTYFERLTDVFTGSDGDLNYALHYSL